MWLPPLPRNWHLIVNHSRHKAYTLLTMCDGSHPLLQQTVIISMYPEVSSQQNHPSPHTSAPATPNPHPRLLLIPTEPSIIPHRPSTYIRRVACQKLPAPSFYLPPSHLGCDTSGTLFPATALMRIPSMTLFLRPHLPPLQLTVTCFSHWLVAHLSSGKGELKLRMCPWHDRSRGRVHFSRLKTSLEGTRDLLRSHEW